jgi:N-methylhydantoinase B
VPTFDPIKVQVWGHALAAIAEEMGATLERTAYSPNIKERLDHSCAVFDNRGRLLAQAAHIPVHLGAMPLMLQSLLPRLKWPPGTMWLCNEPRSGGTHLPDLTLVSAVYSNVANGGAAKRGPRVGFVASRAHHADVGGISPGSLPLSTELFQEGIILSPVPLLRGGKVQAEILELVCANSRTPEERNGDLQAQIAANATGIARFNSLIARYGKEEFVRFSNDTIEYSAEMVRQSLAKLPAGVYLAEDYLDAGSSDTSGPLIKVQVTIEAGGNAVFDFTGSSKQVASCLNATEAITRSACYYVVRCLVEEEIPTNEGCFHPVTVIAPPGSVTNASPTAAVAGGNVETSQRIVDTILRAMSKAAPGVIPAASQGTMNNLTIGGWDSERNRMFAYYETIAGGAGASPSGPGFSAIHCHMTNTRNTPVESLEAHYPLRVQEYSVRTDCPENGLHSGGAGIVRRIELLGDCTVSLLAERRTTSPYGLSGGEGGTVGVDTWISPSGESDLLPAKFTRKGSAGDVIEIKTPGGGGWGRQEP